MLLTYQILENIAKAEFPDNVDMISAFKEVLGFIRDKLHNQATI
jgi:hypothetical protein